MPSPVPYDVAFTILLAGIAVIPAKNLAIIARMLIVAFVPFALGLSIYFLAFDKRTWNESPNDGTIEDSERYRRAMTRSSAIYMIANVLLLVSSRVFGLSYSSKLYNFISLFVVSIFAYIYDRCVSTDDGLDLLKKSPVRAIFDAYLSLCSPSFMRYLFVMTCDVALTVLISYYLGGLIPSSCTLASTLFRKSIIPVVVFTIVGGPLRFQWAYPTVSEAGRVPYLTAYMIAFAILAIVTYASGKVEPSSTAGILILMLLIAMILQFGGLSNAPHEPHLDYDGKTMPTWILFILATIILISVLVITYRIFVDYLRPFVNTTNDANQKAIAEAKTKKMEGLKNRRTAGKRYVL